MKVKLISFQMKQGKYDTDLYGVKIGGIYEVVHCYESGDVSVRAPNGWELPLFSSEFEIFSED